MEGRVADLLATCVCVLRPNFDARSSYTCPDVGRLASCRPLAVKKCTKKFENLRRPVRVTRSAPSVSDFRLAGFARFPSESLLP